MLLEQHVIEQIRSISLQTENERKLSQNALNIIIKNGWFKLFVPKQFDGKAATLGEALQVFEYTSWVDGSLGWAVTIGAGGGYFAGYIQMEAGEEIFKAPEAVIAGSGTPSGTAIPTDGGYIVNGQWKFSSGSEYATTFTANCKIPTEDPANPEIRAFAFTPDQVEIIRDWKTFGLKATNSHSFAVHNQFVPVDRTFDFIEQISFLEEPLFSYPFLPFAQASFAAVSIGIARHLLDEAKLLVERQQEGWKLYKPERAPFVLNLIQQLEEQLNTDAKLFYEMIDRSWQDHVERKPFTPEELAAVGKVCQTASRTALACGQQLIPYLGMSVVMEHEPINQVWRDLQTACQHSTLVSYEE